MVKAVEVYLQQYADLSKQMEEVNKEKAMGLKDELIIKIETINGINFIAVKLELEPNNIKDLAYAIKKEVDNLFLVIGGEYDGKASLTIMISENLVKEKGLDARVIIKETAKEINGGGGGQDFFATAGGKNPEGIEKALAKARTFLK
jgi:alanyl-tRNA synthetase